MKRKNIILMCLLSVFMLFFVACTPNTSDSPTSSGQQTESSIQIKLNTKAVELDIYDEYLLIAQTSEEDVALTWKSSNEAVATVENGKVSAIAEGQAKITVSANEKDFAECTVTVINSHSAPVLKLTAANINVGKDMTATVKAETLWKGEAITNSLQYSWNLADEQSGVISITPSADGQEVLIAGLNYGTATVVVSVKAYDITLTKRIEVRCCNADVRYESTEKQIDGKYVIDVATASIDGHTSTYTPNVSVFDGDESVDAQDIVWSSDDETIAVVDNGEITAKKAGKTTVRGLYDGCEVSFTVNVYRPEVFVDGEYYIETTNVKDVALDIEEVFGTVSSAVWKNRNVLSSFNSATKVLRLDMDKVSTSMENMGDDILTLESELVLYRINFGVYTKVIKTKAEFDEMATIADEQDARKYYRCGYFVLGADIEYNGEFTNNFENSAIGDVGIKPDGSAGGFYGTFDGKGHVIDGLKIGAWHSGVFGFMNGGTIKNVSFINAQDDANANTFLGTGRIALIENVYIHMTTQTKNVIGNTYYGSCEKLRNVFINIDNFTLSETGGANVNKVITQAMLSENVIVVGNNTDASDTYYAYASFNDLIQADVVGEGWDESFWAMKNMLPYPKGLDLPTMSLTVNGVSRWADLNTTITIETERTNVITLETAPEGVVLNGNKLVIGNDQALYGAQIVIRIENVYDETLAETVTLTVLPAVEKEIDPLGEVVLSDVSDIVIVLDDTVQGELVSLRFGNTFVNEFNARSAYNETTKTVTIKKSDIPLTVYGEQEVEIIIGQKTGGVIVGQTVIKTSAFIITSKIMNKTDFDTMKTLAQSANNGGYFILGANIEYNAGTTTIFSDGFCGTFDGRGYYVKGISVNMYHVGIFGKVSWATIKNVSFINGGHDGAGAFLTATNDAKIDTLENVYIQVSGTTSLGAVVGGYIKTIRNVVIDVDTQLSSFGVFPNYWVSGMDNTVVSGLLVIGYTNTERTHGCGYATYADAYAKGTDYSGWDKSFWTVNEGCLPYPNGVTIPAVSVSAEDTVNLNSAVTVQTDKTSVLSLKDEIEGVTVNGNVVTVANDEALLGTSFTLVATSVFDGTKTAEQTVKILSIKQMTVANLGEIELTNTADITITLDEAVTGELTSVKLGDTVLTDFTNGTAYNQATNTVTIKKADIPLSVWGEKTIEILFKQENAGVLVAQTTVKTNALFITMYVNSSNIANVNELNSFADNTVEDYNNIHVFGGYFKLTENLTNIGDNFVFSGNNTSGEFIGVVDGNGYKISTNLTSIYHNGVFGYLNNATIKNIAIEVTSVSNVTAVYWGRVALIENVYIKATVNSDNENSAVIGGGLYNTTYATVMRNVMVDVTMKAGVTYKNPAIDLDEKPTVLENVIVVGNATTDSNIASGTNCQFVANASSLTSVDINSWNTTYWTVTNGLPVWNTKTNS